MTQRFLPIIIIGLGVAVMLFSCGGGMAALLMLDTDSASDDGVSGAVTTPSPEFTLAALSVPTQPPISSGGVAFTPIPTLTPDDVTLQPSPTPIDYAGSLAAIIGISQVRVVDITPYARGTAVLLEIDVLRGYNTRSTAEAVREIMFPLMAADHIVEPIDFSVVLWDRVNRAVNYTWDAANEIWREQPLMNSPG